MSDGLIKRIEEAREGSRDLDESVAKALGWTVRIGKHGYVYIHDPDGNRVNPEMNMGPRFDPHSGDELWDDATEVTGWADECDLPHYTTSIDAALGLVPEGCFIEIYGDGVLAKVVPYTDKAFDDWRGFAATPALALTAAALKAIQEMER